MRSTVRSGVVVQFDAARARNTSCPKCGGKLEWVPDPPMPQTGNSDRGDMLRLKDLPRDRFGFITTIC